jgi:uncharacterized protein (TIGR03382 family)
MRAFLLLLPLLVALPARAADLDSDGVGSELDCNDADGAVFPGAPELCNGTDDDCDGNVDEGDATDAVTWFRDVDEDGAGDSTRSVTACAAPTGHVAVAGDCDDSDSAASPLNSESCDGLDNDCDGAVDEPGATGSGTWYADADGDLYGDSAAPVSACERPAGAVIDARDCDDANAGVHPGMPEAWYDGVDQDCDGNDADADADGFAAISAGGDDCDDASAETFPGAEDAPYDGVDQDCAQDDDFDADGDGHAVQAAGGDDCDDTDASVFPGAADEPYDGVSTDCTPADDADQDADGFDALAAGGTDCDDSDSAVHPGAAEIWYDDVDQDCDGADDQDQDGDGFAVDVDCDDSEPLDFPGSLTFDEACKPLGRTIADGHFKGGGGCASVPGTSGLGALSVLAALGAVLRRRR